MDYRILGPLEVVDEGESLPLGGAKECAVLALLLLHLNKVVPADQLIDEVWSGAPPAGAQNTLQTYISRLRKVLHSRNDSVLHTQRPGYVLRLDPEQLDAHRFRRAVAKGRRALEGRDFNLASAKLREGLDEWRGAPLADFGFEEFARAEIAALEEARVSALEDRIDADLALGRHRDVLEELRTFVSENPLRERAQGQLMLALYRGDRPSEALSAFRDVRRLLVDELGTEPSAPLQRLHRRILRHDPTLKMFSGARATPHNLPVHLTPFIGREWEVDEVTKLLTGTRLLTITGVGGSGKTRLAIKVGRAVLDDHLDGVWMAGLGGLVDRKLVPQVVARALSVSAQSDASPLESLVAGLAGRQLLLILDNCEHVLDSCAELIAEILGSCPEVRILATSRESLAIAGETVWQLPPMAFPDEDSLPADILSTFESVRLFEERAASASPDRRLTPEDAAASARICRRLDGLPLAIELAATRVKLLTPHEIAEHLDDRFALLSRGSRTGPERQQTLRATVDWSFDLLEPKERIFFTRLSAFAGSFTLDAARSVGAGGEILAGDVLDLLGRLVDKSLVVRESGTSGETRYRLLETLRQYGAEKLALEGEVESVFEAHADHYCTLAQAAERELHGPRQLDCLRLLAEEQDNLRVALSRSLEANRGDIALRIAVALLADWDLQGTTIEGLATMERVLSRSEGAPERLSAEAMITAGLLAESVGRLDRAESFADRARSLYEGLDDRLGVAIAKQLFGSVAYYKGDYERCNALIEESLSVYRELNEDRHAALALHRLGMATRLQGDYDRALRLHEESLGIFRRLGDESRVGYSLWMLGVVARYQGDFARAMESCEESLTVLEALDQGLGAAHVGMTLGDIARLQGDLERAVSFYSVHLPEFERHGDQRCLASSFANLGAIEREQGDRERSRSLYEQSLAIRRNVGDKAGIAESLEGLALIAAQEDRFEEAAELLGAADVLREATGAVLAAPERAEREKDVASLRARMGEEQADAAWTRGRRLETDAAVALATAL